MRPFGMMYFCQLLMKKGYFKMRFLYIVILFASVNLLSESIYNFQNTDDEIRFNNLVKEIRCPKCTSGSLASSDAPISRDLKNKIYEMISFGYSDDEIITYVTDRYGNDSSYEPDFSENIVLWLLPLIFLIFCFFGFYLKRRI